MSKELKTAVIAGKVLHTSRGYRLGGLTVRLANIGEVIVLCPTVEAVEQVYSKLMPEGSKPVDISRVSDVVLFSTTAVTLDGN